MDIWGQMSLMVIKEDKTDTKEKKTDLKKKIVQFQTNLTGRGA